MDEDNEVIFELPPLFHHYKSGRIVRNHGQNTPPGFDAATGVTTKDVLIDPSTGLSARLHFPNLAANSPSQPNKLPIILSFHGGAFVVGSAFDLVSYHYLNTLVSKTNAIAVSVDYRLAPEHPLPAAYDDAWTALAWLASQANGQGVDWLVNHGDFNRIFLAGGSAGGNLVHNLAIRAEVSGGSIADLQIEGLVLLHPYFWGSEPIGTESDDVEFRRKEERVWRYVCPESSGVDDPRINPLAPGAPGLELLRCRRVFVAVAEKDWLRERGRAYYEAVKGGGRVEVELVESEGEEHAFFVFKMESEKAGELMDAVAKFVKGQ